MCHGPDLHHAGVSGVAEVPGTAFAGVRVSKYFANTAFTGSKVVHEGIGARRGHSDLITLVVDSLLERRDVVVRPHPRRAHVTVEFRTRP